MNNFFNIKEENIIEEKEEKAFSPFDWLKQITVEKQPWDSFNKKQQNIFNAFIINRVLSFNKYYIPIVELAMAYHMPNDKLYDFYKDAIPKKQIFNKWVKSNISWNNDEIIDLASYFECSTREIKESYSLLEDIDKNLILMEIKGFEGKIKKKKKKNDKK